MKLLDWRSKPVSGPSRKRFTLRCGTPRFRVTCGQYGSIWNRSGASGICFSPRCRRRRGLKFKDRSMLTGKWLPKNQGNLRNTHLPRANLIKTQKHVSLEVATPSPILPLPLLQPRYSRFNTATLIRSDSKRVPRITPLHIQTGPPKPLS